MGRTQNRRHERLWVILGFSAIALFIGAAVFGVVRGNREHERHERLRERIRVGDEDAMREAIQQAARRDP